MYKIVLGIAIGLCFLWAYFHSSLGISHIAYTEANETTASVGTIGICFIVFSTLIYSMYCFKNVYREYLQNWKQQYLARRGNTKNLSPGETKLFADIDNL